MAFSLAPFVGFLSCFVSNQIQISTFYALVLSGELTVLLPWSILIGVFTL